MEKNKEQIVLDFISEFVSYELESHINFTANPIVDTNIIDANKLVTTITYPTEKDVKFGTGKKWKWNLNRNHKTFAFILGLHCADATFQIRYMGNDQNITIIRSFL